MAKRRLSQNQQRRIQANQQKRIKKARQNHQATPEDDSLIASDLGPEQTGTILRHYRYHVEVESDQDQSIRHCKIRQNLETLVCGDRVTWREAPDGTGVVTAILPRRSMLTRPDQYDGVRTVAANIDHIYIVSAPLPELSERMIDRYLVAIENAQIDSHLIINKIDLLSDDMRAQYQARLAKYEAIGYPILWISHKTHQGIAELEQLLKDKNNIFVGQSGVGKSSLINSLHGSAVTQVNDVSDVSGLGQHTTTWSQLYHLPQGGNIIDSPGVREFGLWHLSAKEIEAGFREFQPFLGLCKFRDCSHMGDPGCALQQACDAGDIQVERLESFRQLTLSSATKPS